MSDYHGRIMNLSVSLDKQALACETVGDMVVYVKGHRDARHAAAEIALEADAQLEAAAEKIAQAEALFATFVAESDARAQAAFATWEGQVAQLNAKIRALMGKVAELQSVLARPQVRAAEARFKVAEEMAAALAVFPDRFDGDLSVVGGGTAVSPTFKVQDFKDAKTALAAWRAAKEGR